MEFFFKKAGGLQSHQVTFDNVLFFCLFNSELITIQLKTNTFFYVVMDWLHVKILRFISELKSSPKSAS